MERSQCCAGSCWFVPKTPVKVGEATRDPTFLIPSFFPAGFQIPTLRIPLPFCARWFSFHEKQLPDVAVGTSSSARASVSPPVKTEGCAEGVQAGGPWRGHIWGRGSSEGRGGLWVAVSDVDSDQRQAEPALAGLAMSLAASSCVPRARGPMSVPGLPSEGLWLAAPASRQNPSGFSLVSDLLHRILPTSSLSIGGNRKTRETE